MYGSPQFFSEFDTHSRLIDYCVGMTLGVFMRETIDESFLYMTKENRRFVSIRIIHCL